MKQGSHLAFAPPDTINVPTVSFVLLVFRACTGMLLFASEMQNLKVQCKNGLILGSH